MKDATGFNRSTSRRQACLSRYGRTGAVALALIAVSAVLTLVPQIPLAAQTGANQPIRVDVDLVSVFLSVHDAGGGYIRGLAKEDFKIFEDGVEQQVSAFEKEDLPSTVGVLIDNSLSMVDILPSIKAGLADFARKKGAFNELFAMTFGRTVQVIHDFDRPANALESSLKPIGAQGTSALYDALIQGMRKLSAREPRRKALIVFTDGFDTASKATYKDVVLEAQKTGVLLYFIPIGSRVLIDENTVESLARDTGGRVFYVLRFQPVAPALDDIRQDLSRQYYLGYYGSRSPGFHAIRIEVSKRDAKIRAKSGYYGS